MLTVQEKSKNVMTVSEKTPGSEAIIGSLEAATLSALIKYLRSSIFYDVGRVTAKRIVDAFGARTAEIIETSPDDLYSVRGVGEKRVSSIKNGWTLQRRLVQESTDLVKLKKLLQ
ncbi:MAG TPA: helix-hairpin-helix domain-containing protein [Thermodesulfovibrionales bacterium]|nr:helix-hairpin-helix domain-containing protein [Thermodesulfovibrionales bacterium]